MNTVPTRTDLTSEPHEGCVPDGGAHATGVDCKDKAVTVTLTLEVRGAQASALGASSRAQFGPEGGIIGRGTTCDWVLPNNKVSARHAAIRFADGIFYVEDKSTNGVFVNQKRERLRGRAHALQSGDTIFIEPYEIRVTVSGAVSVVAGRAGAEWDVEAFGPMSGAKGSAADPFADPFAPDMFSPAGAVRPDLGVSDEAGSDRELDPLKLIGGSATPSAPPRRPQARDLEGGSPIAAHYKPSAVQPPPATPPPASAPVQIPEDYDPLADSGSTPLPGTGGPLTDARLEGGTGAAPARPAVPASRPREPWDDSIHSISLEPEVPIATPPSKEPIAAATPPVDDAAALGPLAAILADDQSSQAAPSPAPEPAGPDAPPSPAPSLATPPKPLPARSAPSPHLAATPASPGATPGSGDLAAMLAGAGLEGVEVTEELARDFGRILRAVVSGVMDVLRARQQLKDEFRMHMTQFRPADNNPLKFSANVEDALHNLLVKRNAAYLPPVEAFEDAFDDVRGHQLAMLAGMRVAFDTMLSEFNPDRLQEQFDRQLKKGSLLTVPAKLRYWELYRDYCEGLMKDTESAFRKLFGEAFAEAYEDQLNRLRAERPARRRDA